MNINNFCSKAKLYGEAFADSFKLYDRDPQSAATDDDVSALYGQKKSFTDLLPYCEYLPDDDCFLLDDERSVAAVCDIFPMNSEGVPLENLASVRDNFQSFIVESFPQESKNPWVVEFYQSDVLSLNYFAKTIRNYIQEKNSDNPIARSYVPLMEQHLKDVCKEGGLFLDDKVTGQPWRGSIRVYRMIYYRKYTGKNKPSSGRSYIEELGDQRQRVESQLNQYGVKCERVRGREFFDWMVRWLNPKPHISNGDVDALIDMFDYQDENLPFGHDLAENMLISPPESDKDKGIWYFDGMPHKALTVQNLRRAPSLGALSAPKLNGKHIASLFDKMPEGTVMSMKIILVPTDQTNEEISAIENKVKAAERSQDKLKLEVKIAKEKIAYGDPMFPCEIVFFLRSESEKELKKKSVDVVSILQTQGLNVIDDDKDLIQQDSYIRNMPMNYHYEKDSFRRRSRLMYSQHIANMMPVFGRGKGTGNPGLLFWNRGGEPMCFDPLNADDRAKNAHLLIFGSTGSGKSAQLVGILLFIMAIYNARIFLVEAGNSFGNLREYIDECGATVHKVSMKSTENSVLPPFANAVLALELEEAGLDETRSERDVLEEVFEHYNNGELEFGEKISPDLEEEEEEEEEKKDYLGEMEIIARIIVSGGDKNQSDQVSLGDQQLIRESILDAARYVRDNNLEMVLPEHVAEQLIKVSQRDDVPKSVRDRFFEYSAAMRSFTQGLAGKIFNRPGKLWPDVDFTHVDLGEFVGDNKKAELAVSFMSLLNHVNSVAERDQYTSRPIIFLCDEAHVITKNALLAPGVVKIVKMWRKLGTWLWMATQNMVDFPDESAVMLSLFEWWLCLNLEADEVEQVTRFKKLTKEQEFLLLSTTKGGNYTEGVVMSTGMNELFRAVPPSLTLVLAWSEKEEKAKIFKVMKTEKLGKISAIRSIAHSIDRSRGIDREVA